MRDFASMRETPNGVREIPVNGCWIYTYILLEIYVCVVRKDYRDTL